MSKIIFTNDAMNSAKAVQDCFEMDGRLFRRNLELKTGDLPEHLQPLLNTTTFSGRITDRIFQNWKKEGRQALAIHPDLVGEITKASSTKIPMEIVHALPYINPMVVFPEPPTLSGASDKYEDIRILGFICFGKANDMEVVGTHAPGVTALGACMAIEILDHAGRRVDIDMMRISFRISGEPMTLEEHVQYVADRFYWEHIPGQDMYIKETEDSKHEYLKFTMTTVLAAVLYLCSTTLDIEIVPKPRKQRGKKVSTRRFPEIKLVKIGWNIGPALVKQRKRYFEYPDSQKGQGSGKPQLPQHRRCHFKTTWTGPKRSVPKTVFVAPYWTHREMLGEVGVNTLHPVPKR